MNDNQSGSFAKNEIDKINVESDKKIIKAQLTASIKNDFTNLSKSFTTLDLALKYINSATIKSDLNKAKNVLMIRLRTKENFSSFSPNELQEFIIMFIAKSIVLLISSISCESFILFWKSEKIDYFLIFKPPKKKTAFEIKELYGFITCCLVEFLCNNYLGLSQSCKTTKDSNEIELTQIVDKEGFNILKLCVEEGNAKCVEILLTLNLFNDDPNDMFNPQSRAQFCNHYDILLMLLENNYTYPRCIFKDQFPGYLKNFVTDCENIHKAVILKNSDLVSEIIYRNPKLNHFYNTKNESVLKTALLLKQFSIYELLLDRDIILGPNENFGKILDEFNEKELTILREIHFRCSKDLPEKHMDILMTNTSIGHDDIKKEDREKFIRRAYNVLNKDPQINPILKVVAASKRFTIVFDFKRLSVKTFDPTASEGMRGVFYLDRKICIGAKQLLDPLTEHETFGTLAHELCHYALYLTYRNRAKPYFKSDQKTKEEYKRIIQYCKDHCEREEIINLVFDYNTNMHSAELIVRVVHILAMFYNQPFKINQLRDTFSSLFDYHSDVVIPAINRALPGIKSKADKEFEKKDKKISNLLILLFLSIGLGIIVACLASWYFHKQTYNYDELSDLQKNSIQNAAVMYENVNVKLVELFPENSDIFKSISSDHISQILEKKILNFNDSQFHYLKKQIYLKWENLAGNLRKKFLGSHLNFQGEIVKFKDLFEVYPEAFDALTSQQLAHVLSGNELKIGEKFMSENKFYVERKFIPEYAKLMSFEFYYGHEYIDDMETRENHVNLRIKNKRFQEFSDQFLKKDSQEISKLFDKIKKNSLSRAVYYDLNDEEFHFMYKTSTEIIQSAQKEKILILSSEAGAGKTVTFEQLSLEIKSNFSTRWVSYIDLPKYTKLYKSNGTTKNLLEKILDLNQHKNNFEVRIFEECLKSGNFVLIWNAFDEISPAYNEFILSVLKSIHQTSKNIQLVCTRPLYSDHLSKAFKVRNWQLVPFDEEKKQEFLREFFKSENVSSEKIQENIEKVEVVVKKLKYERNFLAYNFDTPLMLRLIAEIHENGKLFESANIYGIFKAFVEKKIDIWLRKSENSFNIAKKLLFSGTLKITLQKFALLNELSIFSATTLALKLRKLQIMQKDLPNDFPIEEISQLGILFINGKNNFQFSHRTLSEFFVAQFFIENVFDVDGAIHNDEAELRLEMFFKLTQSYGAFQKIITDFMTSYLQMRPQNTKIFNPTISKLLRTKFKNFFIQMLDTNHPKVFEFLFEFFKPDHDLLVNLLHVFEPETFYTAIFNPNHFALFTNPEYIKYLAQNCLTDIEFKKFTTGKNQKGKILFGIHFYGMLNISKLNDAYISEIKALSGTTFWNFFSKFSKTRKTFLQSLSIKTTKINLTVQEQKELFVNALGSKIYLFYNKMFSTADFLKYEKLWTIFEHLLTKNEMQNALGDALVQVFYIESYSYSKLGPEIFLDFFLQKTKKFLSNSQIYEMFLTKNILHETHWDYEGFKILWNFLSNHTNVEERRKILIQDDLDDKNFYFWALNNEPKEKYSSCKYSYFYYDFTPFKIFHRALMIPGAYTFNFTKEIYLTHFSKPENQEIILKSNDFLFYLIERAYEDPFKNFATFLEEIFKGNEKLLKEYLERKIEPTNLSVFELVEDFKGLPFSSLKWFKNLQRLNNTL